MNAFSLYFSLYPSSSSFLLNWTGPPNVRHATPKHSVDVSGPGPLYREGTPHRVTEDASKAADSLTSRTEATTTYSPDEFSATLVSSRAVAAPWSTVNANAAGSSGYGVMLYTSCVLRTPS